MQRASTSLITALTLNSKLFSVKSKLVLAVLTASMLGLTGCQTLKNITGNDSEAVASAEESDTESYKEAVEAIDKGNYIFAAKQLNELRTFYPTGAYAEQALLDLMYSQFQSNEYELAVSSAEQFIKLYPRNNQVDYAYYVRAVANMQAGTSSLLNFAKLNQAHRDTSYYRLAFSNFHELLTKFPNSAYAPDAAQRMLFIYNQMAESELATARWYIKREAYVAAANRAKWVFQYYPQSQQVPEAIAILAYSNEQLGLNDLAQQYKTLLQINYPEWLTSSGNVRISNSRSGSLLNRITYGKLGRSGANDKVDAAVTSDYTGQTKQQKIYQATQLQLPNDGSASEDNLPNVEKRNRSVNLGLGLPENTGAQPAN